MEGGTRTPASPPSGQGCRKPFTRTSMLKVLRCFGRSEDAADATVHDAPATPAKEPRGGCSYPQSSKGTMAGTITQAVGGIAAAPAETPPKSAVHAYVRVRPLSAAERSLVDYSGSDRCITVLKEGEARGYERSFECVFEGPTSDGAQNKFRFDEIFDEETSQHAVFQTVAQPLVDCVMDGFSAAIIAYGQTGSGKTHTMEGSCESPEHRGDGEFRLIPRMVSAVADAIDSKCKVAVDASKEHWEFTVSITVVEIYNEKIRDLLCETRGGPSDNLQVHETTEGVWIQGANEVFVQTEEEVIELLQRGSSQRIVDSTQMNATSSRSHLICILTVRAASNTGAQRFGRLYMADLAGCEKISKTGATGSTLEEAKGINKSLSALGNVIKALTDDKSGSTTHVPFRDSKYACCSPSAFNSAETLSTLRFASRSKHIKCAAPLLASAPKLLSKKAEAALRAQIASLEKQVQSMQTSANTADLRASTTVTLNPSAGADEHDDHQGLDREQCAPCESLEGFSGPPQHVNSSADCTRQDPTTIMLFALSLVAWVLTAFEVLVAHHLRVIRLPTQ